MEGPLRANVPCTIQVNGTSVLLPVNGTDKTWGYNYIYDEGDNFTISDDGKVLWVEDGKYLQYNGIFVLSTDEIINGGVYTTAAATAAVSFKHHYKNSTLIGSGAVKFRRFSAAAPKPMLSAPTNVTVDGTTVSWDPVENATSYDIMVDGAAYETMTPTPPTPALISFTIESTTYQAEAGMTWGQWVDSKYNTGGFTSSGNLIHGPNIHYLIYNDSQGTSLVNATDTISSKEYYLVAGGN